MNYIVQLKPEDRKDLRSLSSVNRKRVSERLFWLEDDLRGDVKRLVNLFPGYRMRAGNLRQGAYIRENPLKANPGGVSRT